MEIEIIIEGNSVIIDSEMKDFNKGDLFFDEKVNKIFIFVEYGEFQHWGANIPVGVIFSENYRHNPFTCKKVLSINKL